MQHLTDAESLHPPPITAPMSLDRVKCIAGYAWPGFVACWLQDSSSRSSSKTGVSMINPLLRQVSGIEYRVCRPDDTPEIGRLLAESFTQHDPPAIAVGLTPDEFEAFVQLWLPGAGVDGLTIVARDYETGQLAGALLTDDAVAAPPRGLEGLTEKFDPIFDLLGQIDTEYRDGKTIVPGQQLHLFLLGVAEQFAGRGIGQQLVAACLRNGAAKGYTSAISEATNPVSQHIFRGLGFKMQAERSYGEYRFDGSAVFASIAEHGGPMTMDRSIDGR
jgi:ribosomal protein S18 acetylase RimI-like enzyme